eukprot:4030276-Lingulodinium_polyedra.AAC.1
MLVAWLHTGSRHSGKRVVRIKNASTTLETAICVLGGGGGPGRLAHRRGMRQRRKQLWPNLGADVARSWQIQGCRRTRAHARLAYAAS